MRVKKIIIPALIITLSLVSCVGSQQAYSVSEQIVSQKPIELTYHDDSKIGYAITKDKSHLYITINASEKITQLKMIQNGATIFIDEEGNKNKDFYIQYPLVEKRQAINMEDMKRMKNKADQLAIIARRLENLGTDILIVENNEQYIINKEFNDEGISIDYQITPESIAYTLKVPLTYIDSESNMPSIGISIKGMKRPNMNNSSVGGMRSGGGRSGGMGKGGGRSGGMRGGGEVRGQGNQQNMSQIQELQSNIEIWIPLSLQ